MPLETPEIELIGKRIDAAVRPLYARLDRTDAKMADVAETLARHSYNMERVDGLDKRVRTIESAVGRNSLFFDGVSRFTGWIVAGAIGLAFWYLKTGGGQ